MSHQFQISNFKFQLKLKILNLKLAPERSQG